MGWDNTDRLGCATNQNSIFIAGRNTLPLAEVNLISLYTDKSVVQHGDLEAVSFFPTRDSSKIPTAASFPPSGENRATVGISSPSTGRESLRWVPG